MQCQQLEGFLGHYQMSFHQVFCLYAETPKVAKWLLSSSCLHTVERLQGHCNSTGEEGWSLAGISYHLKGEWECSLFVDY